MSHHRLEHQIERAQYNQTAVMLMIESCALIRDNTSRAVTSLDNMVLYFMKAKGSENDTSLMGLLQVSTKNPLLHLISFTNCSARHPCLYSWVNCTSRFDGRPLWASLQCYCCSARFWLLEWRDVRVVPSSFSVLPDFFALSSAGFCPVSIWHLRWLLAIFVCDLTSICAGKWEW